jgi:hypothetical protein
MSCTGHPVLEWGILGGYNGLDSQLGWGAQMYSEFWLGNLLRDRATKRQKNLMEMGCKVDVTQSQMKLQALVNILYLVRKSLNLLR